MAFSWLMNSGFLWLGSSPSAEENHIVLFAGNENQPHRF